MKTSQKIGLLATVVILIGINFVPPTELLTIPARNMLGILIAVVILLVTETFPIGITCLVTISALVVFGCCESVADATSGYTNKVLYFVVASFGISEALTAVPASKRMLTALMSKFGKNIRLLLFAIMLCVAIVSSVISNVAACAVFIPIILKMMDIYENELEKKQTMKCYMIALPVASMIGGMATPAGSSINMIAISLLQKNADITITFVGWMLCGIPLVIVCLPLAWFLCIKVFPPAEISHTKIHNYVDTIRVKEKIAGKEAYTIAIVFIMLVLWILSSWYPVFDVTVVALIGLMLFFIPSYQILTWKQFQNCVSWQAFFLIGTMLSMGNAVTSTGLNTWISTVVFPQSFPNNEFLIIGFVVVLTFALLVLIPVAPALVTILAAPLVAFASNVGIDPYIVIMALGLSAGNCYLLPLDTVSLMSYSTGAYRMFDMPKVTGILQPCLIVIMAIWLGILA